MDYLSHLFARDLLSGICGNEMEESRCRLSARRAKRSIQPLRGGALSKGPMVLACTMWNWGAAPSNFYRSHAGTIDQAPERADLKASRLRYRLGQGTTGSTVAVSPLRNVSSTLPLKPPLGHFFGTVP